MSKPIPASELILNSDNSVYHLGIRQGQLPGLIFLVGDPDRVEKVSSCFDNVETRIEKREFKTHIGTKNGKAVAVLSTGIGTDNIDIVLNELHLLFSVNLAERVRKEPEHKVWLIRLGTSGIVNPSIGLDSVVYSKQVIGLDGLAWYYGDEKRWEEHRFTEDTNWPEKRNRPYKVYASPHLSSMLPDWVKEATTLTCSGFYRPQGRTLDASADPSLNAAALKKAGIDNLEMETSGLYLLSEVFGFEALSLNAILADRTSGTFSSKADETIGRMIRMALSVYTS